VIKFERSGVTSALVRYLAQNEKGSVFTYEDLSSIAGVPVTSSTGFLISARRILEREHLQVWDCIRPRIGLRRLTDPEIAERQHSRYLKGANNRLGAGRKQAEVVELDALNLDEQARFSTDSIVREAALWTLSRRGVRAIEKVSRGSSNDLPAFNAVEWMISLSPRRSHVRK